MTDQDKFQIKAIKALFEIHKDLIPRRSHEVFVSIETPKKPTLGLNTKPVQAVLKNIDRLLEGDMLVLAGPIGCGKSVASHIGAIVFLIEKYFEPIYNQLMENSETKDEDKCFEKALDIFQNSADKPKSASFEIVRAFDIIPDSFKEGALKKLIKDPRLLIMDDLGREHFTDRGYGISIWDEVFDGWYSNQVPRIINTNMDKEMFIRKYNKRIFDRVEQCAKWVNFKGGSLRKA